MTLEEKETAIITHYGVLPQLKYFQSEIFELNEAILQYEHINNYYKTSSNFKTYGNNLMKEHITEEIADVQLMLNQFKRYYDISDEIIEEIMNEKADRQLKRIEDECTKYQRKE